MSIGWPQFLQPEMTIEAVTWPQARLGEAIASLAKQAGLGIAQNRVPAPPEQLDAQAMDLLDEWVFAVAEQIGVEAEAVEIAYHEAEQLVRRAAPAILRIASAGETVYLALCAGGRREATVLCPDLTVRKVATTVISHWLVEPLAAPLQAEIEMLLATAQVSRHVHARTYRAILRERLRATTYHAGWLLRISPRATFWTQLRHQGVYRQLAALSLLHLLYYLAWLVAWYLVGRGVLAGNIDPGWLWGWALLLLLLVPLRIGVLHLQSGLTIRGGALLKDRLLLGALQLEPDETRHQGISQLLGRVFESEALETLALTGGFLTLFATIELALALGVLAIGAGGMLHALLLVGWLALTTYGLWHFYRQQRNWTASRMALTHSLVEQMVGYRTRLAQEQARDRHEHEDWALANYLTTSIQVDGVAETLLTYSAKAWLVVGALGLAPAFLIHNASPTALAIGVGGVLSAYLALRRLVNGALQLVGATIAWEQIKPIFAAAVRSTLPSDPDLVAITQPPPANDVPLLRATDLRYHYPNRAEAVLHHCDLAIYPGQKLLLEGVSGGGKSTLAAMLMGMRRPDSGLLLLNGFDRQTWGTQGWHRQVAAAPQFHENHVLTETFAFNLLMGRRWPPTWADLEEAEAICHELGLGGLLERMPGGLMQMVGDTGWQLSHGERSRLYIARTLLQEANLIVLDESFAALDPHTLQQAIACVLRRALTVLVIAHP